MGIPLPASVQTATGVPPTGDQANQVISGTISAVGPTAPFVFYGGFNMVLWGQAATTLTTTNASTSASVSSATGLSNGMTIKSVNVPPGTTISGLSGTNLTLTLPPGTTSAQVVTGADAAATFMSVAVSATVQLERTFDGGSTWVISGVGGAGQQAIYVNPQAISVVGNEPERGVAYRLNCTLYTSGTLNYRLSSTGSRATTNAIMTY